MPSVHAGKVTVLCRWWDRGVSGTVHLPSLQEPAGMLAAVPCFPPALEPSSQLGGERSLARGVGCCNEITVSVFKECFIHYILEMYHKWSKN